MPAAADPFPDLTVAQASEFARIGLANVRREYPHHLQHVLNVAGDALSPRALHPAFYGSYDWHSCVHQHSMLVRLARLFPHLPEHGEIDRVLREHFTEDKLEEEAVYLRAPGRTFFERPYGWAWLLKLVEEIRRYDTAMGGESGDALAPYFAPLVAVVREGLFAYLPSLIHPVRHGVHNNTAFAVKLAIDYTRVADDQELKLFCTSRMAYWFGRDTGYDARWAPSGEDFLSPALTEAEVMAAVLPAENFATWLGRFLPRLAEGEPATIFSPVKVSNPSDPKIAHLIGLNLSRAWCWRKIASALPEADPRRARAREAAARHLAAALPMLGPDDFDRAHWLVSFAAYALTE